MLTFGEEVKRLAVEKGLSQTAIAEACGVRSSFISKLMLGQRDRLGADVFLKLASVLGVSCEYLRPFLLANPATAETTIGSQGQPSEPASPTPAESPPTSPPPSASPRRRGRKPGGSKGE